jgi:hypothetical protein
MRASALGIAVCALLLACGREPTGSNADESGVGRIQAISWVVEFPQGYHEFRAQASTAPGGAGDLVLFTKVRVRMLNADGSVALDTMVAFPPGSDEVQMTFPVTLPVSAPASGAPLALNLRYVNAAGDTVFSGGPVTITAVPSAPGSPAPPAQTVTIPLSYSGPGAASATRVRMTPQTLTLQTGSETTVGAVAMDTDGNVIGGVPILFSSQNVEVATVNAATGALLAGNSRGQTTIRAQLLTGPADVLALTVVSPPKSLALVSGGGQTAAVGTPIPLPVVVKVTASDGGPAAGVPVTLSPSGDGSVPNSTVTTGTDGLATTTWKLGATVGPQTLTAAVAGLAGSPVTVAATGRSIAPVRLAFTKAPSATVAAGTPLASVIEVNALDASGEVAKTFDGPVALTVSGGIALSGSTTVNAVAGVATFTGLSTRTPGTYTLAATAGALIGATTGSFVVNPGPTASLAFLGQPNFEGVAGQTLEAITVAARDAFGNLTPAFTGSVTLVMSPSGASLTAAGVSTAEPVAADLTAPISTSTNAVAGVATFSALRVTGTGTWQISATASGLASASSGVPLGIQPAAPASVQLVAGGGQSGQATQALANPVVVKVVDAFGNAVPGVAVTFAPTTGGGSVAPATVTSSGTGTAQTAWTLGQAAGAMSLSVSATGLAPNALTVSATATEPPGPGPATQLVFTSQPTTSGAGVAMSNVVVTAKDSRGAVATGFTGTVTLAIGNNAKEAGFATGTPQAAAVAGVATFAGLSLNRVGTGYTLIATGGELPGVTSSAFNVTAGAPVNITVDSGDAQSATTASTLPVALVARVRDAFGNLVSGANVAWTVVSGGGALSNVTTVTDANARVRATLTLGSSPGSNSVTATGTGMNVATFTATGLSGEATQLVFSVAPADEQAGTVFNPGVTVTAKDSAGNVATGFTGAVTLSLNTGAAGLLADVTEVPAGPTLGGTRTVNAVAGVARFTDLSMTKAAASYSLTAASGALSATSNTFRVRAAKPKHIRVSDGHGQSNTVGRKLGKKFVVTITDEFENPTPGAAVSWTNLTGTGVLEEQTFSADSSGRAQAGLVLGNGAGKHRVSASVDGVVESPPVFEATGVAAKAKKLVLTGGPAHGSKHKAGASFPQLKIEARDEFENVDSSFTGPVALGLALNAGDTAVAGGKSANAVGGVATFGGANLRKVGRGYRLRITGSDVSPDSTGIFDIEAGPPKKLRAEDGHGQSSTVNKKLAKKLSLLSTDDYDNPTPGVSVSWSSVLGNGEISEQSAQTDSTGHASAALKLNTKAGKHRVSATVSGAEGTPVLFDADAIADKAKKLVATGGPAHGSKHKAGGNFPALKVEAQDEFGNVDSTFTGNISLGLAANPGDTAVAGNKSANAVGGVANFTSANLRKAANGYRLRVTGSDLSSDSTGLFDIEAGPPKKLRAEDGHGQSSTVAKPLGKKLTLLSTDDYDNPTPGVGVSWSSVLGNGEISEQTAQTDAAGRASAALKLSTKSGKHRVSATVTGAEGTPVLFDADAIADKAKKLAVTGGPTHGSKHKAGASFPQLRIEARDEYDNVDSTFTGLVSLGIAANAGGDSAVAGGKSANAVGGIATISNSNLRKAGNGYRLRVTGSDLASDSTGLFDIEPGAPKKLRAEDGHGQSSTVNKQLGKKLILSSTDDYDNPTPGVTVNWSSVLGSGELSEQSTQTDANGRASAALKLSTKSGKHRISATLTGAEGTPVLFDADAIADKAKKLVVSGGPSGGSKHKAGAHFPALKVEAQDEFGNVDSTFAGFVALGLATNPGADSAIAGSKGANAVGGIATFSNANLRKTGAGYRIRASAETVDSDSTGAFTVESGPVKHITADSGAAQSNTVGKGLSKKLVIRATDEYGNAAVGETVAWTNASGGGALGDQSFTTDENGRARASLTLGTGAGKHKIRASVAGLEGNIEFESDAVADNAKKLRVASGPGSGSNKTAGSSISVKVEAVDQYGNVDSSYTGPISLGFASNPGADTAVAGGKLLNATKGVAEFSTPNVRKAGSGYRLRAASAALETDSTAAFNVTAAEANVVTVVSGNSQKGQKGKSLNKPFEVSVTDDFGNSTGGIDVEWTVTDETDDIISSTTVTTDASGKATVTLTLGQQSGKRHVRAAIKNKPTAIPAEFEAEDETAPAPALLMSGPR